MDLTKEIPRSPKDKMDGIVSLGRMLDKARASNEGKLGEYDYDCPHDKPVLDFLGTDSVTFATEASELKDDAEVAAWVQREFLSKKTPQEIAAFNEARENWRPAPGTPAVAYFEKMRSEVAPDRTDVKTWFDLLDLEEKRPVPVAHP
jgi:hypothetical protein